MGDEAVDGSKMGAKFIFFVAILGLALVAFIVGKSLVNTGVDGMEQSVQSINDARYSDYNGKVVRGRAVKSAVENFANEEVAIVVCSLACADVTGTLSSSTITGYDGKAVEVEIKNASMTNSAGIAVTSVKGICYNAQLESGEPIIMKNGGALYEKDFAHDTAGNISYYLNTANLGKKGTGEYVADNSSFNANLIKNSAGEICGILFVQKKLN